MTVTYTKAQRDRAKKDSTYLVTIAVPGMEFQGPVTKYEAERLSSFMTEFLKDHVKTKTNEE